MNCVRKLRSWTPEQREIQSRKLRERKIWLVSTGPKTLAGKEKSSKNSYKHGLRCREHKAFLALMRRFSEWRKLYVFINKKPQTLTNELIDYMKLESQKMLMELEFQVAKYFLHPPG